MDDCPCRQDCVVGVLCDDRICPSFRDFMCINGVIVVDCASSKDYVVPCPNCGNAYSFKQRPNKYKNWLCQECGYYVMPLNYEGGSISKVGFTIKTKCNCGGVAFIFPMNDADVSELVWTCDKCGKFNYVKDTQVTHWR